MGPGLDRKRERTESGAAMRKKEEGRKWGCDEEGKRTEESGAEIRKERGREKRKRRRAGMIKKRGRKEGRQG